MSERGGVRPRVLDEEDYSPAAAGGVDADGDEFLLYSAGGWYAGSGGGTSRKQKLWRHIDNASVSGSSGLSTPDSNERRSPDDCDGVRTLNGASHGTGAVGKQSYDYRCGFNALTSVGVPVGKRLTSAGDSPSSPLSPLSPSLLSPLSRPSGIPVRVTPSSGTFTVSTLPLSLLPLNST